MIEGLKVLDKWCPISRSPMVNVSRVETPIFGNFVLLFILSNFQTPTALSKTQICIIK